MGAGRAAHELAAAHSATVSAQPLGTLGALCVARVDRRAHLWGR